MGKKKFDPLLILYFCPLTKKWSVYNFNGRFIWTVRDRITTKNAFQKSYKLICILMNQISIWSLSNRQDFWLPGVFCPQNNLLDSNQPAFRSGHSTETALLSVVEAPSLHYLSCWICPLLLIRYQIFLSTLLRKRISGTALQWFESYLSDRSFKVSWRGEVYKSQHLAGESVLSSWTTSLLCLHGFTRFCHS